MLCFSASLLRCSQLCFSCWACGGLPFGSSGPPLPCVFPWFRFALLELLQFFVTFISAMPPAFPFIPPLPLGKFFFVVCSLGLLWVLGCLQCPYLGVLLIFSRQSFPAVLSAMACTTIFSLPRRLLFSWDSFYPPSYVLFAFHPLIFPDIFHAVHSFT